MSKTFFISDTHFHHKNILLFKGNDGKLIRPNFDDVNHMNEVIVNNWNAIIDNDDKVYHLGDVLLGTSVEAFKILSRLNGRKVLIKGNHDQAKIQRYLEYFTDIRSEIHKKTPDGNKVIFTHRPIRFDAPNENSNIVHFNVHGHIHQNLIDDLRYINLSVEHTNYSPVSWEEILVMIQNIKGEIK